MEKIKTKISTIVLWVSLLVSSVKSEIIGTLNYKTKFYSILKKNFPEYKFYNWSLKSKKIFLDINNFQYWNIEIVCKVLLNKFTLTSFLANYKFFSKKTKTDTVIYIFKSKQLNNKFVYLLFKNGELKVASFVSPGKWEYKTPVWKFYTSGKYVWKRSKKYNWYPMPFAIHLDGWFYIHWGKIVDWNPQSHWCFRLPGLASRMNFKNIKTNEKIPVIFTGYDVSF